MFDNPNLIVSPILFLQESKIYRKQKILFVLVDILFVSGCTKEKRNELTIFLFSIDF